MELSNTRFGTITYEEQDLIHLPKGMVGMPEMVDFLILDFEETTPFKWMQSLDDATMGFLIADPLLFNPDFSLALDKEDFSGLKVDSPEDLAVFVICTFRGKWSETTGNLMGPIIVHAEKRLGCQIIVEDASFSTHESVHDPVLKAEAAKADGGRGDAHAQAMPAAVSGGKGETQIKENVVG
jgi:flagellar assembly factor FliW